MIHRKIYIGSNVWARNEWTKNFYPAGLNSKEQLSRYSHQFDFIEFQPTHFKTFSPEQVKDWIQVVHGKNFKFCPRITQSLSSLYPFDPVDRKLAIANFLSNWKRFPEHFGVAIMNISTLDISKRKDILFQFIDHLPSDNSMVLKLGGTGSVDRHFLNDLISYLNKHSVALVLENPGLMSQVNSAILYLKLNIAESPDFEIIINNVPKSVSDLYICLHGDDKYRLLEFLQKFIKLKTMLTSAT